jgi:protein-tyrosine phosphatase
VLPQSCYCLIIFAAMKILMVCLGNICRSPLAEGILQHKSRQAGLNWTVESAGTNSYHTGDAPHPLSQKVALLHGIDISRQRSRRITGADFDRYDKIYALAGNVIVDMRSVARQQFQAGKVDLLMNELHPGANMDVPDPYYGEESGYHEVFKMIGEACDSIISRYGHLKTTIARK